LHPPTGALGGLGHEHPSDQQGAGLSPELSQDVDKRSAEAQAVKELEAPVSAGGDKLQLAGLEMASVNGHQEECRPILGKS